MKSITDYGFTPDQLKEIYNQLNVIHTANTDIRSNAKIDGVQYYIDRYNNFYISYCMIDYTNNGFASLVYLKVNNLGETEVLNDIYSNVSDIAKRFEFYQEIKL